MNNPLTLLEFIFSLEERIKRKMIEEDALYRKTTELENLLSVKHQAIVRDQDLLEAHESIRNTNERLKKGNEEMKQELGKLMDINYDLSQKIIPMKSKIAENAKLIKTLKHTCQVGQEKIVKLQMELKVHKQELSRIEKKSLDIRNNVQNWEWNYKKIADENKILEGTNAALQKEITALRQGSEINESESANETQNARDE